MRVLTHHGNQKCILGCEEGFGIVCVRLLMVICFNYIVDLFVSASCTFLFLFHSFQESDGMVDFLHSYTSEKNFKNLKVSIALQWFHETVNFFHWFYATARLQQMDSFISLWLYIYIQMAPISVGLVCFPSILKQKKAVSFSALLSIQPIRGIASLFYRAWICWAGYQHSLHVSVQRNEAEKFCIY